MHAYAIEHLVDHLKEGGKVLDVGSGTGYLCACFAVLVWFEK
jgi:protein-L-isoaspartate(D-aspartate) O-methyltransferase